MDFSPNDANFFQYVSQSKARPGPEYFITITTRKHFSSLEAFKEALQYILLKTSYPADLSGYIEYGAHMGYHFHGITTHKYGHFKKGSGWFALVKEITSKNRVIQYITKERNTSIEQSPKDGA